MKKYKRYIKPACKYFLIAFGLAAFGLILLPGFFLLFHQAPILDAPDLSFHPGKREIPETITVYRSALGVCEEIPFEDYVAGVVSGEMPASFEPEALKAQAVTARTYSLSKVLRGNPEAHPAAPVCDSVHCQVYRSPSELAQIKSAEWMDTGWPKILEAVQSTRGQLMYYQGQLADQALFHSSSGGKTENSEDVFVSAVPYLRSVDSPHEEEATHQNEQILITLSDFVHRMKAAYPSAAIGSPSASDIEILTRSEGGRVQGIRVGGATFTGREIREALNLSSANFTLSSGDGLLTIVSNGYGHGVGMSQYGANGMAKSGDDYQKILSHYYSGIEVY